jgi:tRNA pseudouridine32 synthase/23S rRNA pseudouridine746 synthase
MVEQSTGSKLIERHITIDQPDCKAVEWLADASDLTRSALKTTMQKGAVWLTRDGGTQRLRRASRILKPGDQLHLYFDPEILGQEPPAAALIADEGDYSVWFKPGGMLCQGSKFGDHCTIYRWAVTHLQPERPAFIIHRLDRAAQGLVLLGHKKHTTSALAALFERRQIDKRYQVWVRGCLEANNRLIDTPVEGDKSARSRISTLSIDQGAERTLLEVRIETGRKHQIRRHLAGIGFPVLGDRLYGCGVEDGCDLQLQACYLSFFCPVAGKLRTYRLADDLLLASLD